MLNICHSVVVVVFFSLHCLHVLFIDDATYDDSRKYFYRQFCNFVCCKLEFRTNWCSLYNTHLCSRKCYFHLFQLNQSYFITNSILFLVAPFHVFVYVLVLGCFDFIAMKLSRDPEWFHFNWMFSLMISNKEIFTTNFREIGKYSMFFCSKVCARQLYYRSRFIFPIKRFAV